MKTIQIRSPLCDMIGIKYPIIQAGMGPFDTTRLAVAVSEAGALGTVSSPTHVMVGGPKELSKNMREHIRWVADHTDKVFAANTSISEIPDIAHLFTSIIDGVIEEREKDARLKKQLRVYITSGGNPSQVAERIRKAGLIHFHVVGSVRHAKKVEEAGLDGVIASGYEMGGHTHRADRPVHTFVLLPSVAKAVKIPVIASGGICDGMGLAAAFALGAEGIQMGTRFIATKENHWHENYKKSIVAAGEWSDTVCPGILGPCRVLHTGAVETITRWYREGRPGEEIRIEENDLMRLAERDGDMEMGMALAGQVMSRIDDILSVKEVIDSTVEEALRVTRELQEKIQ